MYAVAGGPHGGRVFCGPWRVVQRLCQRFSDQAYKKFKTLDDANEYLVQHGFEPVSEVTDPCKYIASL